MAEQETTEVKIGKKRKRRESEWKQNQAKKLRNSGKPYESRSKRIKIARGREMKIACGQKCKLKCFSKFSEEQRKKIFEAYWNMGSLQRQRDFIANSMQKITPKYRYVREGSTRRANNAFYFQLSREERIRVCKLFFKNTLDITDRVIRTVIDKQNVQVSNIIQQDLRGKHKNHKKVDEEIKESVRKHISSIPSIESHYMRAHTTRRFIDGSKSVAEIYRDYVADRKKNNLPFAHYITFYRMFTLEFNISFFNPKKDQCETCVAFQNATGEDQDKLRPKYEDHLLEKDLARQEKQGDKENVNKNLIVACYDLQAVFQCPKGEISVYYYKSKLNVLNLTVYEMRSHNVDCFIWHEAEGDRGVNEIGTCIYKYIEQVAQRSTEDIEIIFYTDNCGGQQKNRFMISMYLYAISKFQNIKSIQHKFLITGHTQNEGDSVHSIIERQVKRTLKSGPVYTPDQFVSIVRSAKKNGPPYHITEMSHEEFFDIKDLSSKIMQPTLRNTDNEDFRISDLKVIKVDKEHPSSFFYKFSYSSEEFQEVELKKNNRRTTSRNANKLEENIREIQLRPAFTKKPSISERKKADLMDLVKKNHIPRIYKTFFESL